MDRITRRPLFFVSTMMLVVCLTFGTFFSVSTVSAQDQVAIIVGSVSGVLGETIDINVSITDIENISGIEGIVGGQFEIVYDHTIAEVTHIFLGSLLNENLFLTFSNTKLSDNRLSVAWASNVDDEADDLNLISENGTLVTLRFRLDSVGSVDLIMENLKLFDESGTEIHGSLIKTDIGSITVNHGSKRLSGTSRFLTSIAISQDTFPEEKSADAVVIARSHEFADALPGGVLAYQKNGPLLLTRTSSISEEIVAEITRVLKDDGTIYILGGQLAVSAAVEAELSGLASYTVTRIAGGSRMETASRIAETVGSDSGRVIVAFSHNFPDALAVSSYAAREGIPILLTGTNLLHEKTAEYLMEHTPYVYVVGGTFAVSEGVYNQIGDIVGLLNIKRLSGAGRYETARVIAEEFFPNPQTAAIVYGWDFPDALTGGVNAAHYNAPILLVDTNLLPSATEQFLFDNKESLSSIIVYGGAVAVSVEVETAAQNIIK